MEKIVAQDIRFSSLFHGDILPEKTQGLNEGSRLKMLHQNLS